MWKRAKIVWTKGTEQRPNEESEKGKVHLTSVEVCSWNTRSTQR